ncbi:MAG: hypothetical protein RLZZ312_760 [Bacteroidota bacterium]
MIVKLKFFMVMLGCRPKGRYTEQHDIFFGIGSDLKELLPEMKAFWPEAKGKIHIDAWREVTVVDGFRINIIEKKSIDNSNITTDDKLFFLNLGGYKPNEFEEYHYKILTVSPTLSAATKTAKATTFYRHCGFEGATSHIDDKFGIDVDDFYNVQDILDELTKSKYSIEISKSSENLENDKLHIGYVPISKL